MSNKIEIQQFKYTFENLNNNIDMLCDNTFIQKKFEDKNNMRPFKIIINIKKDKNISIIPIGDELSDLGPWQYFALQEEPSLWCYVNNDISPVIIEKMLSWDIQKYGTLDSIYFIKEQLEYLINKKHCELLITMFYVAI